MKTPRGAILVAFTITMFVLWVGPSIMMRMINYDHRAFANLTNVTAELMPVGLLLLFLGVIFTSAGEKAITFTPSEMEFLFSGPFHRRELLAYKLTSSVLNILMASILFTAAGLVYLKWWLAGYVGLCLSLLFLQLLAMTVTLTRQIVSEHIVTRARKLLVAVVTVLVALGVWSAFEAGGKQEPIALLKQARDSWAGVVLLAPFQVFGNTITADRLYPNLVGWGGGALAINLVLFVIVMRLDANYLEASASVSRKIYDRRERMKRGGLVTSFGIGANRKTWVPGLNWWYGCGPIVRQQLITISRSLRTFLWLAALMILVSAAPIVMSSQSARGGFYAAISGIGVMIYFEFLFAMQLPFAFRGELDHFDWLKSLPISARAIAWGELFGIVAFMTVLQLLYLACVLPFAKEAAVVLGVAAVFVLPFNMVLFGVENLVFLLYPSRVVPSSPGDIQHIGRSMLFLILKSLLVFACVVTAAGAGFIAYWISGWSWVAFAMVACSVLSALAIMIVELVGWAFERFDPSVDIPA